MLAYAAAAGIQRAKRTRWDYEVESPLRDARGFDLSRSAGPPPVVDADEVGAANMILTNGARLYVDHAHPEYSAPECTDPLDAVIWDKAGERVMEAAARHVASVPGAAKLQLYKNNVDGKGASYGSHENYLMSRQTPFSAIITGLTLVGVALMKTSPPSVTKKTAMRQPSTTAQAANIGADRGHSRRHRPRMVSTEGRPRFKNQLSASTMAAARAAGGRRTERLMPAYPSAGPCLIVHLLRGPLRCSGSAGLA
ncbi:pup deamidase/depupylase [Mycobacterium tuberculosis M1295]|nr:pup deamidase/depupylase [Mycobacterium tuberculosis M1295]